MKRIGAVRGQDGMASIVVVSVLIIILTLISLGFARLISRSVANSANRQYSASATNAALSGINDVAAYLKKYVDANGADSFLPRSAKCNGPGSLIGNTATPGPFYDDSNLSGDAGTRYTCILLNPTPNKLSYPGLLNLKSQVVKVNTSAVSGALNKLMISWQPSDSTITGFPTSSSNLYDETTWNDTTGVCKENGNNARCIPILRLTISPLANNSKLSDIQSKTVFLYPQDPGANKVKVVSYTNNGNFPDGSIIPVDCTPQIAPNTFNPSTTSDYVCNIIIDGLAGAIAPADTDSVYLRLTPIYNQADVQIAANDKFGNSLSFVSDQAVVDITAQTGGVAKRLQARVNTSSLAADSNGFNTNIASGSDNIPEQSIRSAVALCKRMVHVVPANGFASFVSFDAPDNVCHTLGFPPIVQDFPAELTFSITGNNGKKDNGLTVDSEADNPDVPQNPVQKATVYVGDDGVSGVVTLNWVTKHASTCTASVGNAGDGWAGDKSGLMTFTGNPPIDGKGNQQIGNIDTVTEYDLVCGRLFAADTPIKKVYAWPMPKVSINVPASIEAGSNYDVGWSVSNSTTCAVSGGNWSNPGDTRSSVALATFSQTMNWPVNDNNSTRSFTVTCKDPVGRVATDTKTVSVSNAPGNGQVVGPTCRVAAWFSGDVSPPDNGNNFGGNFTGSYSGTAANYATNCDYWDAANTGASRYVNYTKDGASVWTGFTSSIWLKDNSFPITSAGTYCLQVYLWASPWASQADATGYGSVVGPGLASSGTKCITISDPLTILDFSAAIWNQAPECGVKTGAFNNTWFCRLSPMDGSGKGTTVTTSNTGAPPCADGVHRWTACAGKIFWSTSGGVGNIDCTASANNYGPFDSSSWGGGSSVNTHSNASLVGWIGLGDPRPLALNCIDSNNYSVNKLIFPGLF